MPLFTGVQGAIYSRERSRWNVLLHDLTKMTADWMKTVMSTDDDGGDDDGETGVLTRTKSKTKRPPMYKVLLLNDDYTPMEFVVHVLERYFSLNHAESFDIMLTVHKKGLAVVGVFTREIAETKVAQVMESARQNQHPLQCTMEKE